MATYNPYALNPDDPFLEALLQRRRRPRDILEAYGEEEALFPSVLPPPLFGDERFLPPIAEDFRGRTTPFVTRFLAPGETFEPPPPEGPMFDEPETRPPAEAPFVPPRPRPPVTPEVPQPAAGVAPVQPESIQIAPTTPTEMRGRPLLLALMGARGSRGARLAGRRTRRSFGRGTRFLRP